MADAERSVLVRVRGNVTGLESAYKRGGKATDDFADRLERAEANSRLLSERQDQLGQRIRGNASDLRSYNRELDRLGGTSTSTSSRVRRLSAETERLERNNSSLGRVTTRTENQLDSFSGRIGLILQGLVAFGPGVTAAAVTPLIGLAAQAGATGIGLGVLIGSFQGVGDAIKATNKAAIEPTTENLQAQRQALAQLSPEGAKLVREYGKLRPELMGLRNIGQTEMFPGIITGVSALENRLPAARKLMAGVSEEIGHLVAEAGKDLSSEDWDAAFNYAIASTPPLLDDVGHSLGNLLKTSANLWVALAPLTGDWSSGLEDTMARIESASEHLDESRGFQDFLSYAEEVGPEVMHTLGQIGGALISIGKAGAPISGPLIKGLGDVAEIVGDIADSDLGTPLVAGAIGLTAFNKALSVTGRLQKSAMGGFFLGAGGGGTAAGAAGGTFLARSEAGLKSYRRRIGEVRKDVATLGTTWGTAGARSQRETLRANEAATRLRGNLRGVGRGAAGLAAITVASTGAADGIGLTNTATLALAGSMLGPWGAAGGAGVGLYMDIQAASKDTATAVDQLNRAAKGDNIVAYSAALTVAKKKTDDLGHASGIKDFIGDAAQFGGILGGKKAAEQINDVDRAQAKLADLRTAVRGVSKELADGSGVPGLLLGKHASAAKYQAFLDNAAPALHRMGVSAADLRKHAGDQKWLADVADGIADYNREVDSAAGRTDSFVDALRGVDDPMVGTAQSADKLAASLSSLLTPQLNAEAAADNLAAAYDKMKTTLSANRGAGFSKSTEKGRENRAATRDVVTGVQDRLSTAAANGASASKLAGMLKASRDQFIAEGKAAGFSAQQIAQRANQLGLTPKLVRTVLQAVGADESAATVNKFAHGIKSLPKAVQTAIRTDGVPRTNAQIDALARKYNLTPKQVRTLASLKDQSSVVISKIMKRLAQLAGQHPTPRVSVKDNATPTVRSVVAALNGIHDRTATITVRRVTVGSPGGNPAANKPYLSAAGNFWPRGTRFYDAGGLDVANAHTAFVAQRGTPMRVFNEPETLGESYIPHADDWRRPRAKAITEQTARLFGGEVTWHAAGSISHGGHSTITSGGFQILVPDQQALAYARGIAAAALTTAKSAKEARGDRLTYLQQVQQISQLQASLREREKTKHGTRYVLRGINRREAQQELRVAHDQLADIRNAARQAIIDARNDTITTLSGTGDIFARGSSPSSVIASVNRQIADIGRYGSIVGRLKSAGASPALLKQVIAKAEAGDFRSATRLGEALLAQPQLLTQLNTSLASLGSVTAGVASLTTDPRLLSSKAWAGASQVVTSKQVNVDLTQDPSALAREISRVVIHEVQTQLAGAVA